MDRWLSRSEQLIGEENLIKLQNSCVAVIGLGGVGSATAEAVCRAGVGRIIVVDSDTIDETNINRQIIATRDNIGKDKCVEIKKRLMSINPNCEVVDKKEFILPDNIDFLFELKPDFIIDAIDTVTAKICLVEKAKKHNIGIITCLGTGNRLDPTKFQIADISATANGSGCPLARIMRKELKNRGIDKLTVVFSTEMPKQSVVSPDSPKGRHSPSSIAFVPPVAGYILASHAVAELIENSKGSNF